MATPRMKALQNLAANIPVASQRIATGQKAAQDMQIQQAVKAAPQGVAPVASGQVTGAAVAQNAGQQAIQNAQKSLATANQIGQLETATQGVQNQADIASQQLGNREQKMDQVQKFAQLNEGLKRQLYDETMKFKKDELGRTKFNEQQLADYARLNAQSDEQFRNYQQKSTLASKRKMELMEQAYRLIEEDLKHKYAEASQRKDMAAMDKIRAEQRKAQREIDRKRTNAANNRAAASAGGSFIGGILGTAYGGPSGGQAGAGIGGGIGGASA